MELRTKLAAAGLAGASAAGLFAFGANPASAATPASHSSHDHAVFVLANDPAGNNVAVYDRNANGTLTARDRFATGGLGGVLTGSVVDHLASQGALTYDSARGLLYAVNAGSNTVTTFAVHGDSLERLQVVGSGGTFPVSVAVHGSAVYVLNARDGGSIQGFLQLGRTLVRIPSWHRNLGLNPAATPEFVNTPGQVALTPNGRQLIVTTKANGSNVDVFGVDRFGGVSANPTVTADPGGVPFAVAFDAAGRVDISEAGTNAVASFTLNRDNTLTLVNRVATGQAATCWIVSTGTHLFADNAGSGSVSRFDVTRAGVVERGTTATDGGTIDAALAGHNLYVQTGANGTVDEYTVAKDGSLTAIGSVTVPGSVGGEGIAAS